MNYSPEFFDIFGLATFSFLFIIAIWSLKTGRRLPHWAMILILFIGVAGLLVDGVIVYKTFIAPNVPSIPGDMSPDEHDGPPFTDGECRPTGCSSQVCSDRDIATTCEWREEYACYKSAVCERQNNGDCGWTETPEFNSCMREVKGIL